LEYLFVPAVVQAGYEPWLPTVGAADLIHSEFVRALCVAELVLVDFSGHNPNVLFEFGLRTACDRAVALVRDEQTELPFDVSVLNCHCYNSTLLAWKIDVEIERLANHVKASAMRSAGHNPFWQQFGVTMADSQRIGDVPPLPKQRRGEPPHPTRMPLLASA
jgi:hypothetical protein